MGRFLFWVAGCCLLLAWLSLLFALRSYQAFTEETLVATLRCEAAPKGSSHSFLLKFTPMDRSDSQETEIFPMHGDQWTVGGDILKWSVWVNLMGLKTCHKLTRLSSRYMTAADELKRPRSAYDLNGGTDFLWRWLYRFGGRLPLVEAVYGNAAYTMAQPGTRWGVYVTVSGYLVKPLKGNR